MKNLIVNIVVRLNLVLPWAIFIMCVITPPLLVVVWVRSFRDPLGEKTHQIASLWTRTLLKACLFKVRIRGLENARPGRGYIIMPNHSSQLDIFVLLAFWPFQHRWLSKASIFKYPVFGRVMRQARYIPINRENPREALRSLDQAAERIRAGYSVVIFPEGTRSLDGRMQAFKRGGFLLATKTGLEILPVTINGAARALPSQSLHVRPGRIELVVHPPIPTAEVDRKGQEALMDRVRQAIAQDHDPYFPEK